VDKTNSVKHFEISGVYMAMTFAELRLSATSLDVLLGGNFLLKVKWRPSHWRAARK
jgi:hypothetical protein